MKSVAEKQGPPQAKRTKRAKTCLYLFFTTDLQNPPLSYALLMLAVICSVTFAEPPPRATLSLDGAWSFQLDPKGVGEQEQWFHPSTRFSGSIQVPGAWDAQGFGDETDKLNHNYVGKGWYRRTVEIPREWAGRRIALCFGGVYRSATIWIDGHPVGSHLGYISNFEFDVTPLVKAGTSADVVVLVDSEQHWEVDALQGCMDIIDGMYTGWGGIWSHIALEARSQVAVRDLYIEPRTSPPGCVVSGIAEGDTALVKQAQVEILDADGAVAASKRHVLDKAFDKDGKFRVELEVPNARLWTPESPYLYCARITLLDASAAALDQTQDRFGVRTIEIRGTDFYVNGVKYYLNGYGDDCVYPDTIAPPADKQFYLDRLRVAKSYGFNYVRHHSHFVAPEYYEACDELGMFVSAEFPIAYPRYYARALASPKAMDLHRSEWSAVLKRYRNHPSIFDWAMCNEMWGGMPELAPGLYKTAKELDPSRPVIDSDGLFTSGFVDGTKDRPTLDFYTIMFDILTSPLDNPNKFKTSKPIKPIVTHEEGNFSHFPRLDQIELYRNFKPFWLTDARDRIARAGLLDETPAWAETSQQLYLLLHKANIEALRKNPNISGYDWWLLQPWYAGSNGLLDGVRRPTSITTEQVRRFNAPVVLLQDGLRQTYKAGDTLTASLSISNYSGKTLTGGAVVCTLEANGKALETRTLPLNSIENGTVATLGSFKCALPNVGEPQRWEMRAALDSDGAQQSNEWTLWVYPSEAPRLTGTATLYASRDAMGLLEAFAPIPIPEQGALPGHAVYVARQPNEALLKAAERGSCVVLLSPAGIFPTDVTSYKSAWWLGVFDGDSNAGTYVYDNPVTRGLTPSRWCDASWFHLLQGAQTMLLDGLSAQPDVLIRALNGNGSPEAFSRSADMEYVWRNKSLLAQARVGKGSLIVSGLNFDVAMRNGGPEAQYVLARLIGHAQTLPRPKAEWPVKFVKERIEQSAFAKGPLLNGFKKLVCHKGDVAQAQSYRAAEVKTLRVRQVEPFHRIEWETAPAPDAPFATFVFAGAVSFMPPPAGNPGYTMVVNGTRILDFDSAKTQTCWKSEDRQAALLYVPASIIPTWSTPAGLFYLSVPRKLFVPGEPCRIEVRSRGADEQRFFGLQPYDDIVSDGPAQGGLAPAGADR